MKIRLTIDLDVGDTPTADGITYLIYQYGMAPGDDHYSPEEWSERVVLDAIENITDVPELQGTGLVDWRVLSSHVAEVV